MTGVLLSLHYFTVVNKWKKISHGTLKKYTSKNKIQNMPKKREIFQTIHLATQMAQVEMLNL